MIPDNPKTETLTVTEQVQIEPFQMTCPKCKVGISMTDDPIYGKVYVCEDCGIIVIELHCVYARAPS